jgi:DNA phosphorothioation-dependent restriction protein DptG
MEDNKNLEQIYAALLDGFHKAKRQKPDLDVDAYIMEYLSQNDADGAKEKVKESLDFITDLDRNTAQVMEDTKYERLDDWFQKNVVEQVADPKEREELEQGLRKASEEII